MNTRSLSLSQAASAESFTPLVTGILQRKCASCGQHSIAGGECTECGKKKQFLQRRAVNQAETSEVPSIVHDVLRSPGQPLDAGTRAFMEPRFGHDFSSVRVHTDAKAAQSARAVKALAYTVGRDIAFEAGQYAPGTKLGQRLLAHELTHVVQQSRSNSTVQTQLKVGTTQDFAESEADRVAEQVVNGAALEQPQSLTMTPTPILVRRAPNDTPVEGQQSEDPQRVGQNRVVTLPTEQRGQDQVVPYVLRSLVPCPCRQVSETRQGAFWNPDLRNFAIAYRYCRGSTSVDVYGQLQSNVASVISSGASPEGTARIGTDINVAGRSVGGRVVLEATGTNEGVAPGVGGRAQAVLQGQTWLIFLEADYLRRLRELPGGANPNEWRLSVGGQFRGMTIRGDLSQTGNETRGMLTLGIPLDTPRVREERCVNCFCPPPTRKYRCIDFVLDRDEEVRTQIETHPAEEFRYYFDLDRVTPSSNPTLQGESNANLDRMTTQVRHGGLVELIRGYASPESTERRNQDLSERRARRLGELVRQRVGTDVSLPQPFGGGELLGRRPMQNPSSRLGEVITQHGFRSAEDLSILLTGDEIPNSELSEQFISLFNALPEPADRLAVFGLTNSDRIAPQVLAAINQFMRSRGRGYRPWERLFQLLRVGIVRVRRRVMVEQTETLRHQGATEVLSDEQCRPRAASAEAMTPGFGPIDPAALRPTATPEESRTDCLSEPRSEDIQQGCNYTTAGTSGGRPTAPAVAPTPLGQLPLRLP